MSFDPYRKWLGIPSNRRPPNYYELLGITAGEKDADVIRSAIDQRRMYIRSKKGEGQDGHVKAILGLIEEASSTLLVPEFKHGYDRQLGLHVKQKGSRRSYVLPSWMESRVVRVYGEGSGIVGDVLGIISILLVAFGLMAWWSFRLHDEQETVLSDPAPIIEQKASDEMENKAPAIEPVEVPVVVNSKLIEKTNSVQELEQAAIFISTPDAVRLLELEVDKPRLYDSSPLRIIDGRKAELKGWQFTSIPQRINNSYEIIANKPTTIYAFGGGKKFTAADFFGTDAAKWESATGDITGINVNVCVRRELRSGETLRLSGFELQICAESMVLSKSLQPEFPLSGSNDRAFSTQWQTMFDGKNFNGWKVVGGSRAWQVENGELVCNGDRSHLYYVGGGSFKNFHFRCDAKCFSGSNSGVYFHTRFENQGYPKLGFECQIASSGNGDRRKTGSLYGLVDVINASAQDGKWFTLEIIVKGKRIEIKVDDKVVVDYTEPANQQPASAEFERLIGEGIFALQSNSPNCKTYFRDLRVKRLKD